LAASQLAVDPDYRNRGVGTALVRRAIARARLAGHGAILLVGDAAYYGHIWMLGEYERDRLLALELKPGALADARGPISAKVTAMAKADSNTGIAVRRGKRRALLQHAA
jgi:predicted N-acetyltransferase YhbS